MIDYVFIKRSQEDLIEQVYEIFKKNVNLLGPPNPKVLKDAAEKGWLLVALDKDQDKVVGFVNFRNCVRKDQCTIYEICVDKSYWHKGIGAAMIAFLAQNSAKEFIRLKCTEENDANGFYKAYGFTLIGQEMGKKRKLNVYELRINEDKQLSLFKEN